MTDGPILLTGVSGQLGFQLARELAPLAVVVAPTRAELDLASAASIRAVVRNVRPSLVVNAGAYTAVDRAESQPELCRAVNAEAPRVLAEEVRHLGGGMIHYSTDYVFDGTKAEPYTETDTPNPLCTYGEMKLAGECAVISADVPHLIFRTSWVYGSRGRNFANSIMQLARERQVLQVVADQFGAPTWSRYVASTTALVIARLGTGPLLQQALIAHSGTYHLTAGGTTSWFGFADALLRADPRGDEQSCRSVIPVTSEEYPTPARRPRNSVLENGKLVMEFGIRQAPWDELLGLAMSEWHGTTIRSVAAGPAEIRKTPGAGRSARK